MRITLIGDWEFLDGNAPDVNAPGIPVKAGTYEVELVDNPRGRKNAQWYVLKGTKTGMAAKALRQWRGKHREGFRVIIHRT